MNRPWFVQKRYGIGLSPNGWRGWAATLIYVALLAGMLIAQGRRFPLWTGLGVAGLSVGFLIVMIKTSDGLPWRWRRGGR